MGIVLGHNQYGKAETHLVRVDRDTARHEVHDVTVSTALRGDFAAAHVAGDQAGVLPTDTQKNTVFAFAKQYGVGAIEDFALRLAEHFVTQVPAATGVRVEVREDGWSRIEVDGAGHDHAFVQHGGGSRTTLVDVADRDAGRATCVVSGVADLVVLKTTGSEFKGFLSDQYTTLAETSDRVLATSLLARWRYVDTDVRWDESYRSIKAILLAQFAQVYSHALQETLYAMGRAVLEDRPEVAEIRFAAPNRHHFTVDLAPVGLDNPGEVFYAADRPYGLIQVSVLRDEAAAADWVWHSGPGWC